MTRPVRSTRRAAALYALYVLLTTAFAVLVVQVGIQRVGGRQPAEQVLEIGDRDDPLRVRTGTPTPRSTPGPSATSPSPRATSGGPASTGRPSTRPPATKRPATATATKPPPPKPPPPPPPPPRYAFFLKTIGSGNRASTATLPLSTARPTASTVPNYDVDRDDGPGLRIGKGGSGPAERDPEKIQAWTYAAPAGTRLSGPVRVTLWYALQNFGKNGRATVRVTLQDCAGSSCVTIGSGSLLRTSWTGAWQGSTFSLGSANRTLAAGHSLRLTVVTDKDIWVAYDTTGTPSALRIG